MTTIKRTTMERNKDVFSFPSRPSVFSSFFSPFGGWKASFTTFVIMSISCIIFALARIRSQLRMSFTGLVPSWPLPGLSPSKLSADQIELNKMKSQMEGSLLKYSCHTCIDAILRHIANRLFSIRVLGRQTLSD